MGLDITAYSAIGKFVKREQEPELDYHHNVYLWLGESFHRQADGMSDGWYELPAGVQTAELHWSYSGYNRFRASVIRALHGVSDSTYWEAPKFDGTPLRDILYFSDCEGVLGPDTCAKLAREASEVFDRVGSAMPDEPFNDRATWEKLVNAIKLASAGGIIRFS